MPECWVGGVGHMTMSTFTLVWSGMVLVFMTHSWSRRYLGSCGKGRTWSAGGAGGWRGGACVCMMKRKGWLRQHEPPRTLHVHAHTCEESSHVSWEAVNTQVDSLYVANGLQETAIPSCRVTQWFIGEWRPGSVVVKRITIYSKELHFHAMLLL